MSEHAIKSYKHKYQEQFTQEVRNMFHSRRRPLWPEDDCFVPRPWKDALTEHFENESSIDEISLWDFIVNKVVEFVIKRFLS
tara:strand:+ start:1400 stop:1645 length:246 start_codon:yes stop_codon:yes gene_type:complete